MMRNSFHRYGFCLEGAVSNLFVCLLVYWASTISSTRARYYGNGLAGVALVGREQKQQAERLVLPLFREFIMAE